MREGFFEGWGRYLFNWFSFVFTVVGAAIGLYLAREHGWISVLIVIAILVASARFAYAKHRENERLAQNYEAETEKIRQELNVQATRTREAEGRLIATQTDLLRQISVLVAVNRREELARELIL